MNKQHPIFLKNWLLRTFLISLAVFSTLCVQAQSAPSKLWDKTFGGNSTDRLSSMQQTTDGGYILGGTSSSGIGIDKSENSLGWSDYWVVKLDANGIKQWDKTYGGSSIDHLTAIQQTTDGGYILGGWSVSGISIHKSEASRGGSDYWVVKLDANGNKIWDKTYGGSNPETLLAIQQTSDGGYILGGYSASPVSGEKSQPSKGGDDFWIVKLDVNGNKIWDKTIGSPSLEIFYSLSQTSDGGYLVGGYSWGGIGGDKSQNSQGMEDYWIVKLDANGNKMWDKTFGGSGKDVLFSVKQTIEGGYILGGYSQSGASGDKSQNSQGGSDYWIIKLDSFGNKTWDKTFGSNGDDIFSTLIQTTNGGYLLGGWSNAGISGDKTEISKGGTDFWLVRLDSNGNKQWDKTFGGALTEELYAVQQTSDGSFVIGGYSNSYISNDKSQVCFGIDDYWVVKLGTEILGSGDIEPASAILVFPNPSQGTVNIKLDKFIGRKFDLTVLDLLGRLILEKEISISDSQFSQILELPRKKGIYILQLKNDTQILQHKIVVE